jgi:hypothetical protein
MSLVSMKASAQGQKSIGAGVDIMLPVGSFADSWGTGFGGTAEFDYSLTPKTSVTGKIGYLTWSGKNLPSGVTATYSGVPVLAGIKFHPRIYASGISTFLWTLGTWHDVWISIRFRSLLGHYRIKNQFHHCSISWLRDSSRSKRRY